MPSLEQRLFHCIEKNLVQKEQVMDSYSKLFEKMCEVSEKEDIGNDIVLALNAYKKEANITAEDIAGFSLLHTKKDIDLFQHKFMMYPFLFGIILPDDKWALLKKKLKEVKWAGGLFIPAFHFSAKGRMHFDAFGFSVGTSSGIFQHEALHANRRLCSANCIWLDGYHENPAYSDDHWRARVEYNFLDELLPFVHDDISMNETESWLHGKYWNAEMQAIASYFTAGNTRKHVKRILKSVKKSIPDAVKYSYRLKNRLSPEVLAPLFYSLGTTPDEAGNNEFYSAFADIALWVQLLDNGTVNQQMIRSEVQKKGYCANPVVFSMP